MILGPPFPLSDFLFKSVAATGRGIIAVGFFGKKEGRSIEWPTGVSQDEALLHRLILENEECQVSNA